MRRHVHQNLLLFCCKDNFKSEKTNDFEGQWKAFSVLGEMHVICFGLGLQVNVCEFTITYIYKDFYGECEYVKRYP